MATIDRAAHQRHRLRHARIARKQRHGAYRTETRLRMLAIADGCPLKKRARRMARVPRARPPGKLFVYTHLARSPHRFTSREVA